MRQLMMCLTLTLPLIVNGVGMFEDQQVLLKPEDYHPDYCNVTSYKFAFLHGLVHGLWPEVCSQCTTCSYPTCCHMDKFGKFVMPKDTSFIDKYWFNGESHHPGQVCGIVIETLFEHEVLKHASCMGLFADDYVKIVSKVFNTYHSDLDKLCHSKSECELDLNWDFSLRTSN